MGMLYLEDRTKVMLSDGDGSLLGRLSLTRRERIAIGNDKQTTVTVRLHQNVLGTYQVDALEEWYEPEEEEDHPCAWCGK